MNYLVSYDISKDNLRTRVGDKLIANGLDRVQRSVYIGIMNDETKTALIKWLQGEIALKGDSKTDTVIVLPLLQRNVQEIIVIGKNNYDLNFLAGSNNSLLL